MSEQRVPRKVTYEFYSIPWTKRMEILVKLMLLRNEDENCTLYILPRVWQRAVELGQETYFANEVQEAYKIHRDQQIICKERICH